MMEGFQGASVAQCNGQYTNAIAPIKFETEPYYDVGNNHQTYNYDSPGMYSTPNQYDQGYPQYPSSVPNTVPTTGVVQPQQPVHNSFNEHQIDDASRKSNNVCVFFYCHF